MMAVEEKETIQRWSEAYVRCLPSNVLHHNMQYNTNFVGNFPGSRDEINSYSGGQLVEPKSLLSGISFVPPNEGYYRQSYQQQFHVQSPFHPDTPISVQNQFCGFESSFYPRKYEHTFPMDVGFGSMPFTMSSQSYQPDSQFQEFHYFVVIDFEATCDKERKPQPQEIIEFPSVLVNSMTGQVEDCFQIYVRPTYNQVLTDFCKELTGIQQAQVDKGVLLSEALLMHDKWLEVKGIKNTKFAVVTWSNWDCRVMLESECRLKGIQKPPYFNRWINLKVPFQEVFGGVRCNLKEAIQVAGLVWEGRAHCGLDDARNTAHLLMHLMRRGFRFRLTDSLICQSADCSLVMQQCLACQPGFSQQLFRINHPSMPLTQFQPFQVDLSQEQEMLCYCGVKSSKRMVWKPEPKHGSCFFGCGNWTATGMALCSYFQWASA